MKGGGGEQPTADPRLAFVLGGGGARAAYQVGVLRHIASRHPNLAPGILTGVSAGGLIAMHLAMREGNFATAVASLTDIWLNLRIDKVFRVGPLGLSSRVTRWGAKMLGGGRPTPRVRSLVDTAPLRRLLEETLRPVADGSVPGIARNLAAGRLNAVALTASSYTTGQSVTWVESRDGCRVLDWEGPERHSESGNLGVDQVMASSALPFFFPAVKIEGAWYGDGGIRLDRATLSRDSPGCAQTVRGPHTLSALEDGSPSGGERLPAACAGRGCADERDLPRPAGRGRLAARAAEPADREAPAR